MAGRLRRSFVALALAAALGGCSGEEPAVDASMGADAGARDAGVDAGRDAAVGPDSGADAGIVPIDAGTDAGAGCGPCVATSVCETAACVVDTCVRTPAADGTICDGMGNEVCVDGACVMRACGDGWRESTAGTEYEECDDANTMDGDGCSSTCTSNVVGMPVTMGERGSPTLGAPAMAEDGTHAALVVWTADAGSVREIRAKRFDAHGVPVDEGGSGWITVLGALSSGAADVDPTVAGLAGGGWVVVWHRNARVEFRLVDADGSLGTVTLVGESPDTTVRHPRVAALEDGFVVVWTTMPLTMPTTWFDVKARRYGPTGASRSAELAVPEDDVEVEDYPSVASSGDVWMVTWIRAPHPAAPVGLDFYLAARRFRGDAPLDATDLRVSDADSSSHGVTDVGAGAFGIVHRVTGGGTTAPYLCVIDATDTSGCAPGGDGRLVALPDSANVNEHDPVPTSVDPGEVVVGLEWTTTFPAMGGGDVISTAGGSTVLDAVRMTLMGLDEFRPAAARARGHGVWATWGSDAFGFGGARTRVYVQYVPIDPLP